jgi:catechol 2,3-dioxygenase-like lactoylglutathione lyase family enzyme
VEAIIAGLLNEFERGGMTKRQLIQSLALSAVAAAGAVPAVAATRPAFKTLAVNHISYGVADYARTRDFYADLLGMTVAKDDGRQCELSFGDTFIIPRKSRHPEGKTPFIDHVAYTIDDWDRAEVEAELKRRGLDPRPDTDNSFHIKDPDGFDLQICGKAMKA